MVGDTIGDRDGLKDGRDMDGLSDGKVTLGALDGPTDGLTDGISEGIVTVGNMVGKAVERHAIGSDSYRLNVIPSIGS